jgi:hypothetical protein
MGSSGARGHCTIRDPAPPVIARLVPASRITNNRVKRPQGAGPTGVSFGEGVFLDELQPDEPTTDLLPIRPIAAPSRRLLGPAATRLLLAVFAGVELAWLVLLAIILISVARFL